MSRALPLVGLASALALGTLGAVLLAPPSVPPPRVEEVAPAMLALPHDPLIRVRATDPAATPTALVGAEAKPTAFVSGVRVRVPRLRIDVPLELGDAERDIKEQSTPVAAAYLLPGMAVPGTTGNAYVYAHARPGLFLALWTVRLGDVVEIAEPSGTVLRYAVTEIHPRVDPTDARFIAPTDDERLTLQTSTGAWVLSPRFIVVARPIR